MINVYDPLGRYKTLPSLYQESFPQVYQVYDSLDPSSSVLVATASKAKVHREELAATADVFTARHNITGKDLHRLALFVQHQAAGARGGSSTDS